MPYCIKSLINEMKIFSDNVPFVQMDINYSVLHELEIKYNIKLDTFVPFKSGMVSLIFKGQYQPKHQNVQSIVVKLQRTNIRKKILQALDQIHNIIILFTYFKTSRIFIQTYKIQELFNINKQTLLSQLNFKSEILNTNKIKNNCKNLKYIIIPHIMSEITDEFPTVIVMDFISGICLNQVEPEDSIKFAKQLIKFGIVTSVIHGCVHGDFHSGNVLFIKNTHDTQYTHKIGVIDFGIICNIQSTFKQSILIILSNIFTQSSLKSAIQIIESGVFEPVSNICQIPKVQYNNIADELAKIIEFVIAPNTNMPIDIFNIYTIINIFYSHIMNMQSDILSKYDIYISNELVNLQGAIAMAHGPTFSLCGENYKKVLIETIEELFHLKYFNSIM